MIEGELIEDTAETVVIAEKDLNISSADEGVKLNEVPLGPAPIPLFNPSSPYRS